MMRILTTAQVREADRRAVEELGIPAASLMEAAGLQVVEAMEQLWGSCEGKRVAVVCGKGNNGGDGYVIARHLARRGAAVQVLALAGGDQLSPAAAQQAQICAKSGMDIRPFSEDASGGDWIVDAVFGTGFRGPARGDAAEAIAWINRQQSLVASVDLPSGCNADTGQVEGPCVRADLCVALAAAKPCHYLFPAAGLRGRLAVRSIGIPSFVLDQPEEGRITLFAEKSALALMPTRRADAHKKNAGTVLVVAGSGQYTGAALLAARAAFRCGAGFVHVAAPRQAVEKAAASLPEAVWHAAGDGELGEEHLRMILDLGAQAQAAVLGPGVGRGEGTARLMVALASLLEIPTVLDADALHALAAAPSPGLSGARGPRVLTPHSGEAAALLGCSSLAVDADRLAAARTLARSWGQVALLKGPHTVVARPVGEASLNASGNEALATAGSGDVLSGMLGAFLAQGLQAWDAARLAAWTHGTAADRWRDAHGSSGMTASDLLESLPPLVFRDGKKSF